MKAVPSILDPETEFERIVALVKELEILDEWLAQYKNAIR